MKVTVSDNQSQQEKEIKFPVLMESVETKDLIVMFLSKNVGVVVSQGEGYCEVGTINNSYGMFDDRNYWNPLPNGVKVTLENDL